MLDVLKHHYGTGKRNLWKNVFAAINMQQPGQPNVARDRNLETQVSPREQREPRSPRFTMPIGTRPFDGYTIKRGIGAGGFGEVYYAKSDGGKDVALKCVQRNLDIELRGVRQCLNIKHPNLLALFDIKQDDQDQVWVIMEFVSGDSLQAVIERHPEGLPLDLVTQWFDGIAAGVGHLHECGIVHRDLKPANLFVEDGTIKIGDYGLSKFISCSRRSAQTQSVGTFHYMAPEIGQGRYGKEIDVYAVGIMLYEMLTGNVPFDGESSQEIIMKHLTARPSLEQIATPLRPVLTRALEKDPALRFHSMQEMRLAFQQAITEVSGGLQLGSSSPIRDIPAIPVTGLAASATTEMGPTIQAPIGLAPDAPVLERIRAALPNEPIAEATISAIDELSRAWNDSNLGIFPKILIAAVGIIMIIFNASWIMPLLGALAIFYAVYLAARMMLVKSPGSTSQKHGVLRQRQRHEAALIRQQRAIRRSVKLLPAHMRQEIADRDVKSRLTEFLGSLLCAAAVATVFSLVIAIAIAQSFGLYSWGTNFVWLAISSTVAAWSVLLLGKLWETTEGDGLIRRIWMAIAGAFVGMFTFGLAKVLAFQPTYVLTELRPSPFNPAFTDGLYEPGGMPRLTAFMLFFVTLFAGLRWWRQADPTRRFRLSLLATLFVVAVAVAVQAVLPIPQAFLVAGVSALAVQIAAPWITSDHRNQLRQQLAERLANETDEQQLV